MPSELYVEAIYTVPGEPRYQVLRVTDGHLKHIGFFSNEASAQANVELGNLQAAAANMYEQTLTLELTDWGGILALTELERAMEARIWRIKYRLEQQRDREAQEAAEKAGLVTLERDNPPF